MAELAADLLRSKYEVGELLGEGVVGLRSRTLATMWNPGRTLQKGCRMSG